MSLPIRQDIKNAIQLYADHGYHPGGFLTAVLQNDLFEAFGRADSYNLESMPEIIKFIWNEIPGACHGSKEKFEAWVEHKRQEKLK